MNEGGGPPGRGMSSNILVVTLLALATLSTANFLGVSPLKILGRIERIPGPSVAILLFEASLLGD